MKALDDLPKAIASGVIAIVIVAALWQGVAVMNDNAVMVPTLPAALAQVDRLSVSPEFWANVLVSLRHLAVGYVPALIGIPIGLGLAVVPPLRVVFGGLFNGLAAAPLIASAPLLTAWFGIGDISMIALVFVVALVALAGDVMTGLVQGDPGGVAPADTRGMTRCIIAALRRSFLLAVTAMLVGEMVASSRGLGFLLMSSVQVFNMPQAVAVFFIVAVPCAIFAAAVRGIERLV